jgi:hypothetical protein
MMKVSNTTTMPTNLGISCNDETLPNFIEPKHPTEGENKEQKEMT